MQTDALLLFRRFRHDLLNELQILSGHLQLGRPRDVLMGDTMAVIERIQEVSQIFACHNDQLALLLWEWQEQARDSGVSISFDIAEVNGPVSREQLDLAATLVTGLFGEILQLTDEEQWLHVAIADAIPAIVITTSILSTDVLPAVCTAEMITTGTDGEMAFTVQLG